MSRKIERIVGELTEDETRELIEEALNTFPTHISLDIIIQWAKDVDMTDELAERLSS
jgi:hypothetical protein